MQIKCFGVSLTFGTGDLDSGLSGEVCWSVGVAEMKRRQSSRCRVRPTGHTHGPRAQCGFGAVAIVPGACGLFRRATKTEARTLSLSEQHPHSQADSFTTTVQHNTNTTALSLPTSIPRCPHLHPQPPILGISHRKCLDCHACNGLLLAEIDSCRWALREIVLVSRSAQEIHLLTLVGHRSQIASPRLCRQAQSCTPFGSKLR